MKADEVARQASSVVEDDLLGITMEVQNFPSIKEFHTFAIQGSMSWMAPIIPYLKDGHLPSNLDEARKIMKRATRFTLLNDALYKKRVFSPLLEVCRRGRSKVHLRRSSRRHLWRSREAKIFDIQDYQDRLLLANNAKVSKGLCQEI